MTARSRAAVAALALLVAGCGTAATPYQPMNLEGGYASTKLGADTFNVVVQGNAHTLLATAQAYALYRSAELTVEAGFDYFLVLGGTADETALRAAARNPTPPAADQSTDNFMVSITVRAFSGVPSSPQAFDARAVLTELAPSIRRQ